MQSALRRHPEVGVLSGRDFLALAPKDVVRFPRKSRVSKKKTKFDYFVPNVETTTVITIFLAWCYAFNMHFYRLAALVDCIALHCTIRKRTLPSLTMNTSSFFDNCAAATMRNREREEILMGYFPAELLLPHFPHLLLINC